MSSTRFFTMKKVTNVGFSRKTTSQKLFCLFFYLICLFQLFVCFFVNVCSLGFRCCTLFIYINIICLCIYLFGFVTSFIKLFFFIITNALYSQSYTGLHTITLYSHYHACLDNKSFYYTITGLYRPTSIGLLFNSNIIMIMLDWI